MPAVALGLSLRLLATLMFAGLQAGPNAHPFYDGVEYNAIAGNLVRLGEYSVRPGHPSAPWLPFALAGVYALFGVDNYLAARFFFCDAYPVDSTGPHG